MYSCGSGSKASPKFSFGKDTRPLAYKQSFGKNQEKLVDRLASESGGSNCLTWNQRRKWKMGGGQCSGNGRFVYQPKEKCFRNKVDLKSLSKGTSFQIKLIK